MYNTKEAHWPSGPRQASDESEPVDAFWVLESIRFTVRVRVRIRCSDDLEFGNSADAMHTQN